jgi:hypothetical protein
MVDFGEEKEYCLFLIPIDCLEKISVAFQSPCFVPLHSIYLLSSDKKINIIKNKYKGDRKNCIWYFYIR